MSKRKAPSSGFDIIKQKKPMRNSHPFLVNSSNKWIVHGNSAVIFNNHTLQKFTGKLVLPKIAAFDMDGTLVKPKSGAKFPKDRNDWTWLYPSVPKKLKEVYEAGFEIVIFTNQKNSHEPKKTAPAQLQEITAKIEDLSRILEIPLSAYIGVKGDLFRKPNRGSFDLMLDNYLTLIEEEFPSLKPYDAECIDREESFYVGDAAGRDAVSGCTKDHSDADLSFATNVGLKFYTPEEWFLKKESPNHHTLKHKSLTLKELLNEQDNTSEKSLLDVKSIVDTYGTDQHVVMIVGPPASGKSTLSKTIFKDYVWVNQDEHGTNVKCAKLVSSALADGKSVVIDNTHSTTSSRAVYLKAISAANVPVYALVINIDKRVAMCLNQIRANVTKGLRSRVPSVAFHSFYKNFVLPSTTEAFTRVDQVFWEPHPTNSNSTVTTVVMGVSGKDSSTGEYGELAENMGRVSLSRTFDDFLHQRYDL